MDLSHSLGRDVKNPAIAVQQENAKTSAEDIAHRDPAHAAKARGTESGEKMQLVFIDKVAGKGQQPLIRHRETNDPEDKE
jgi:hypothetical protein